MDYVSVQKFVLNSPKKLRDASRVFAKAQASSVLEIVPHVSRRAVTPIMKVLKTAVANAKQKGEQETELFIKEIQINEGMRLKRGRAGSRGRLKPYKRRMSHIRVVLTTRNDQLSTPKLQMAKNEEKVTVGKEPKKGKK